MEKRMASRKRVDHRPIFEDLLMPILNRKIIDFKFVFFIKLNMPDFPIPLAKIYDPTTEKLPFKNTFVNRKIDGVRLLVLITKEGIKFISRNGKEYFTLTKLGNIIKKWKLKDSILDGELVIDQVTGEGTFQQVIKEIRRKNHTIESGMIFYIFDWQSIDAFSNRIGTIPYYQTYLNMTKLNQRLMDPYLLQDDSNNQIQFHFPILVESFDELQKMFKIANKQKWEGLMLRNEDSPYEGKRTKNLLKYKKMLDAEFPVIGAVQGKGKYAETLGALLISNKGVQVNVGSGINDRDRDRIWNLYKKGKLPKFATIQYFEITPDGSLRFPVFKAFRE